MSEVYFIGKGSGIYSERDCYHFYTTSIKEEQIPCEQLVSDGFSINEDGSDSYWRTKNEVEMCKVGCGALDGTCLGLPCGGFVVEAEKAVRMVAEARDLNIKLKQQRVDVYTRFLNQIKSGKSENE